MFVMLFYSILFYSITIVRHQVFDPDKQQRQVKGPLTGENLEQDQAQRVFSNGVTSSFELSAPVYADVVESRRCEPVSLPQFLF